MDNARTVHGPAPVAAEVGDPYAFHASLLGYAPTPLRELPALATRCGVSRLWVKDETRRLGLPSFKILGASWACFRVLAQRLQRDPGQLGVEQLRAAAAGAYTLVAATDGNHGLAVARVAGWWGLAARIYVPHGMVRRRVEAIEGEGAQVVVVDGTYDDAVAAAASETSDRVVVVSDMAWEGYETVPRHVVDGYSTIFREIDKQLPAGELVDTVVVQVGVGALAAAVARWLSGAPRGQAPSMVACEPVDAACLLRSLEAGRLTAAPGPHRSHMAGLNCGNVSPVAWPFLQQQVDLALTVDDVTASVAVALLETVGIQAGPTGAAGLAGLLRLADDPQLGSARDRLQLAGQRVLLLVTEGRT